MCIYYEVLSYDITIPCSFPSLQSLPSQHQRSDTADIARPPARRPQEAQSLRLDKYIRCAKRHARQRIPQSDAINRLSGNTRMQGKQHYPVSLIP